jgi:hypothetical protein
MSVPYYQAGYDIGTLTGTTTYQYGYAMMNSYAISSNQIGPAESIYQQAQQISSGIVWSPHTIFGVLAFALYTASAAVFTNGWTSPIPGLTGVISTLVAAPIAGLAAAFWLQDQAIGLIADAASAIVNGLYATFKNVIDAVWNTLVGIGEFLWAIGEGIWDVINVLWDGLVQYGAILLSLLVVFVGLMIFFVAVHYQLKLWGIAVRMAKGDLSGADREAQGLMNETRGRLGKIKGLI